jgi:biotin carboxyl carrier protein
MPDRRGLSSHGRETHEPEGDGVYAASPAPEAWLTGEGAPILERLVVSPADGTFRPFPPKVFTVEGEIVYRGQEVGTIHRLGDEVAVISPFTGFLMGHLAFDAERVRAGQPLVWLRPVGVHGEGEEMPSPPRVTTAAEA